MIAALTIALVLATAAPKGPGQPPAPPRQAVTPPARTAAAHDIRPGPGVTAVKRLSDYSSAVAGTPGDTAVYVLEGKEPGGTVFVAGGTHGNEIAGIMAAVVMVERARLERGRLIVVPHANNSAITDTDPERPGPPAITLETPSGQRQFRYGSRRTKAADQGAPDPAKYRHPKSTEELPGNESRNLNRAYPGRADGTLTERMAFAIVELIKAERVDVAFDLHEAGPESRLAWMVVANPKNLETAAVAVLALEAADIPMKLEPSSEEFRGLSHREWGDATKAQAYLFETPSPGQVNDPRTADVVNDPKLPLARRVGVQLASFAAVIDAYNDSGVPTLKVTILDLPREPDVTKSGVGAFLK